MVYLECRWLVNKMQGFVLQYCIQMWHNCFEFAPVCVCGRSNCSTNVHFHILCNATLCGKRISSLLCYALSLILFILPNHWYTILLLTHPEALFLLFSFPLLLCFSHQLRVILLKSVTGIDITTPQLA